MAIELKDLRWALLVAQHRSLRQSAELLNVRQSTLSRRLTDIESTLGVILFERTNVGTRPTDEGIEFLKGARGIIEAVDETISRLRTRSRGESGRLTIGIHASPSAGNLRTILTEHRRRFPDVETLLIDGSSDHLVSDLSRSAIDLAFLVEGKIRWNGRSLSAWSERVVVAIPENHPLNDLERIHWDDLEHETLLLPQRGPGPELLSSLIGRVGYIKPSQILRYDAALDRLLMLVGTGRGILLALEGATGMICRGVHFREVFDVNSPARLNFHACWRQTNDNPSLRPFLDMLQERHPDLSIDVAT
jgi:DNA-binding transcriptional LysR family regulator